MVVLQKRLLILHVNDLKVDFDVYDVEQAFLSVSQERKLYVGHPKGYVWGTCLMDLVTSQGGICTNHKMGVNACAKCHSHNYENNSECCHCRYYL